jgi:hypothetical protein
MFIIIAAGRAQKAIKFEAELIGFDGSLIGRSRHLPKVQTPQTAMHVNELYQSVTAKSARHIFGGYRLVTSLLETAGRHFQ